MLSVCLVGDFGGQSRWIFAINMAVKSSMVVYVVKVICQISFVFPEYAMPVMCNFIAFFVSKKKNY